MVLVMGEITQYCEVCVCPRYGYKQYREHLFWHLQQNHITRLQFEWWEQGLPMGIGNRV